MHWYQQQILRDAQNDRPGIAKHLSDLSTDCTKRHRPAMRANILAFAIGVFCLQWQADLPAPGLISPLLCVSALLVFLLARSQRTSLQILVAVLSIALGFTWAAWRAQQPLAEQLPEAWEGRDVVLSGVIATLPQNFEHGQRFEFAVESMAAPAGLTPVPIAELPRRIMLSWYRGRYEDETYDSYETQTVHPGERWRLTVRLKRPHGNANPHGFDYEAWLFERGIRATGYVRPHSEAQRGDAFVWRPEFVVERLRDVIYQRFVSALPEAPYLGVLIALTIGEQRVIPSTQWTIFNRTGITHLVSISGLHVTMVAALFAALLGWSWRRSERLCLFLPAQKAAVIAGWLAAFAYALLAGFAVPAQRTLYMLSIVAVALYSGRNLGASRTLLFALLCVLLFDPWAVLAAGFWLSFGAVALLLFVGSERLTANAAEKNWRTTLTQWGVTQWAVTIGSLPLLLLLFQQFSLVSPIANAVAIPLVSFVITPLALLFAAVPWPPVLTFDHWLMSCLMRLLEWLADWPVWQQAAPPVWAALLAGLGVVWSLLPRGFPARWLGLCLMLPAFFWPAPRPAVGDAWLEVLDVGQGLAVLVRTAKHALLYDTGPLYSAESDAGQRIVVPYLRATGVDRLDAMIVTHRDKDHSGGVRSVQEAVPIARTLSSVDGLGEPCMAGQSWDWDGVRFTLLHPTAGDYEKPTRKTNDMSCVLRVARIDNADRGVLLTADIEARDEKALLARSPEALRSAVMLAPHHGSRTSSTPEFIAAVNAREVIFPVGYRNRFNHPRPDVVERYAGRRLWRSDYDGAVRIVLSNEIDVTSYRRERRRYWHGQ